MGPFGSVLCLLGCYSLVTQDMLIRSLLCHACDMLLFKGMYFVLWHHFELSSDPCES